MNEGLGELRVSKTLFYAIGNCVLLYKKRSAKEALLAEKKLVVNDTARARKSPTSGLFVLQGNDFPVI